MRLLPLLSINCLQRYVFFWALYSVPLLYMSVFMPVPSRFDYYGLRAQAANTRPAGPSGPPPCFIRPGTLFLPGGSTRLSLTCKGVVTFVQSSNYIRPFEGNQEADVAPSENEFDTPALEYSLILGSVILPILFFCLRVAVAMWAFVFPYKFLKYLF